VDKAVRGVLINLDDQSFFRLEFKLLPSRSVPMKIILNGEAGLQRGDEKQESHTPQNIRRIVFFRAGRGWPED